MCDKLHIYNITLGLRDICTPKKLRHASTAHIKNLDCFNWRQPKIRHASVSNIKTRPASIGHIMTKHRHAMCVTQNYARPNLTMFEIISFKHATFIQAVYKNIIKSDAKHQSRSIILFSPSFRKEYNHPDGCSSILHKYYSIYFRVLATSFIFRALCYYV